MFAFEPNPATLMFAVVMIITAVVAPTYLSQLLLVLLLCVLPSLVLFMVVVKIAYDT